MAYPMMGIYPDRADPVLNSTAGAGRMRPRSRLVAAGHLN